MQFCDTLLPYVVYDFLQCLCTCLGVLGVVTTVNPWLLLLLPPLSYCFWRLRTAFLQTSREARRLESVARSPVFALLGEALEGLTTIRRLGASDMYTRKLYDRLDAYSRPYFIFVGAGRHMGFRVDFLCWLMVVATTYSSLEAELLGTGGKSEYFGMSIMYVLQLAAIFQWCIRQSSEVENYIVAVERILEVRRITYLLPTRPDRGPHGAAAASRRRSALRLTVSACRWPWWCCCSTATCRRRRRSSPPPASTRRRTGRSTAASSWRTWRPRTGQGSGPCCADSPSTPSRAARSASSGGQVGEPDGRTARASAEGPPGRQTDRCTSRSRDGPGGDVVAGWGSFTGAGKTSALQVLFRLIEPSRGDMWIDGVSITELGLHDLRKKLSVIPQVPFLFSASMRENLDPESLHTDMELWDALEEVSSSYHRSEGQASAAPKRLLVGLATAADSPFVRLWCGGTHTHTHRCR